MRSKALGCVVAMLAVMLIASVAMAQYPGQSVGQGSSDIWVMNLDGTNDANVVASYVDQDGNPDSTVGATVDPLGNTSFPASSSGLGNNWLGSMVLYSDKELASVASLYWSNQPKGDGWSGAEYSGYSEGANELFFAGIAKTKGHRTLVTIQCVDTTDCAVWMTYRRSSGSVVTGSPFMDTIEPDSQESYDLWDPTLNPNIPDAADVPANWFGSLQVTSTQDIAGVQVVHFSVGYAAAYNAIIPGTDTGTEIRYPAVNRRNFTGDWKGNSDWQGLTVQNTNDYSVTVYVSIYSLAGGAPVLQFSDDIPAYSSHGYNTKTGQDVDASVMATLGNNFLGSAIVTSTEPIAGISGLVRYPSGGLAGGYNAMPPSAGSGRIVHPALFRVKSGSMWTNVSALQVQNLDPSNNTTVTFKWRNPDGSVALQFDDVIPANSSHAYNTRYGGAVPAASFNALGTSWRGPVDISTSNPYGIMAVVTSETRGSGYMYITSGNLVAIE